MELGQLRYFVAAAEELSMTAAARRRHVSQPALSRQIAALEDELGAPLFNRVKKRIYLTDAGRFFLGRARQILCDLETSAQQFREKYGSSCPTIRLGYLAPFLDDIVSPAVQAFRAKVDRVEIALFELAPRAQLDRLRSEDLDVAVLGNLNSDDMERFESRTMMRSRMAAVLPIDHRFARRKRIRLAELREEEFVSLSDAVFPGRRKFLQEICASAGFEPKLRVELDSLSALFGSLAMGIGVAVAPAHSGVVPHKGCVIVRLQSPTAYAEVFSVTRRGPHRAELTILLEDLKAAGDAVVDH